MSPCMDNRIDFDSLAWEEPMGGVRFKAYQKEGRRVRLVEFARDFVEREWCTKGHIGYVLSGEMEIRFSGEVIHFGPGDGLFIPAGSENKHMAKVLTDTVRLLLVEDAGP